MAKSIYKMGREFLRPSPRMDAISWQVLISPFNGKASGQFEINWRGTNVLIHTLDQTDFKQEASDDLYVRKLETILGSISQFRTLLKNRENGHDRLWLNPKDTLATGSVAYCFDKHPEKTDYTIFFELGCCTSKFRMWVNQYTPRSIKEMDTVMKKLHHQLSMHYAAMTSLQAILIRVAQMQAEAQ